MAKTFHDRPLGRKEPTDDNHIKKYPFSVKATLLEVNHTLKLPTWHWTHDQGQEGSCVGHGSSMMMSLINHHRYNPIWLWNQAKVVDEWPDTNPGDDNGTSVRASCDVLRDLGHAFWKTELPVKSEGLQSNRWALTVDDMRAGLQLGIPISIGINWYENFDRPEEEGLIRKDHWIGRGGLGRIRGGHCVCLYGASDKRQAFRVKNSWGRDYPLVWLPYTTMQRLLNEYGEATLVTDL